MDEMGFGLSLTVVGMGTVFGLLILLMGVLLLLGRLDRHAGEIEAEAVPASAVQPVEAAPDAEDRSADAGGMSADLLAAIALAVTTHAQACRREAAPVMRRHQPGSQLDASRWVATGRGAQTQPWRRR